MGVAAAVSRCVGAALSSSYTLPNFWEDSVGSFDQLEGPLPMRGGFFSSSSFFFLFCFPTHSMLGYIFGHSTVGYIERGLN